LKYQTTVLGLRKKIKPPAGFSAENQSFLAFEPATFACLIHLYDYQGNALPPKPRRLFTEKLKILTYLINSKLKIFSCYSL
jgi:hypothetical protein